MQARHLILTAALAASAAGLHAQQAFRIANPPIVEGASNDPWSAPVAISLKRAVLRQDRPAGDIALPEPVRITRPDLQPIR